jgi:uncharacterized protein (TIGR00730 family)
VTPATTGGMNATVLDGRGHYPGRDVEPGSFDGVATVLRRVCVFCGASAGVRPEYRAAARQLADLLVSEGIGLVYGGASIGLMGELADAVMGGGGEVIGVIPRQLYDWEIGHTGVSELRTVDSMHERKATMFDLADGFIALPGGLGTLEELFEILTWLQLGFHVKPAGLVNALGYFGGLSAFLNHTVAEGFLLPAHRELLLVEEDPATLLAKMRAFRPPIVERPAPDLVR